MTDEAHRDAADGAGAAPLTFHGAVTEFKRHLIERTLSAAGGNRTRAARALGLQRTYLLRLMREFGVDVPRAAGPPPRRVEAAGGERPAVVDTCRGGSLK
jgi:DNA-binding NtrC family response regulator